jgi:hypothetical protein
VAAVCGVDWSATGDMMQGVGSLLSLGVIVYAAKLGASTFKRYQQEKVTDRRLHYAERTIIAADKAKRALARVRSPIFLKHEMEAAEETLKTNGQLFVIEDGPMKRRTLIAQALLHRLDRTNDILMELDACVPMARALFGEELVSAIQQIDDQYFEVQINAETFPDIDTMEKEGALKVRQAATGGNNPNSEITKAMDEAVAKVNSILMPVLQVQT